MASDLGPVEALRRHILTHPEAGEVALLASRAGVGKSALLVHFALEALLAGRRVMHVSVSESVDHVRAHYDEIHRVHAQLNGVRDRAAELLAAERNRMIHSYADRRFDPGHLRQNLEMLAQFAQFQPELLLVDGLNGGDSAHLQALAELARERSVPIWVSARLADGLELDATLTGPCKLALFLAAEGRSIGVTMHRDGEALHLPLQLDAVDMTVVHSVGDEGPAPRGSVGAEACTLYSGGARGTESFFGECAEAWGVREVNFTFEGHKQERTRGSYALSPRELQAGDVSLLYVSRRLSRTYSEGSLIRKVLQTLWHMVSRSQQVFVVGTIQEDGTVVGGTGWSVELARMWGKALWVFDLDKGQWFRFDGTGWVPGVPVIDTLHFTGTGTRYLNEVGEAGIRELFERSFGALGD